MSDDRIPLFLGGPADGRRIPVEPECYVCTVPVERKSELVPRTAPVFESVEYVRHVFSGDHRQFSVFTPLSWTLDDILVRLIARYIP